LSLKWRCQDGRRPDSLSCLREERSDEAISHPRSLHGRCHSNQSSSHRVTRSAHRVSQRKQMALRAGTSGGQWSSARSAYNNLLCETLCALGETLCPIDCFATRATRQSGNSRDQQPDPTDHHPRDARPYAPRPRSADMRLRRLPVFYRLPQRFVSTVSSSMA
jgi:hypothetical protein